MNKSSKGKTIAMTVEKSGTTSQRGRLSSDFPKHTLLEALAVPQALEEKNGGQPLPPVDMAIALGRSPAASSFKIVLSSSIRYGLTTGSYNGLQISLEPLGVDIVRPTSSEDRQAALVRAALVPPTFTAVFNYYKGKKVPEQTYFENAVVREFGVPKEHAKLCVEIFVSNMEYLGLVRNTTGGKWFASDPGQGQSAKIVQTEDIDQSPDVADESSKLESTHVPRTEWPPGVAHEYAILQGNGMNQFPRSEVRADVHGNPNSVTVQAGSHRHSALLATDPVAQATPRPASAPVVSPQLYPVQDTLRNLELILPRGRIARLSVPMGMSASDFRFLNRQLQMVQEALLGDTGDTEPAVEESGVARNEHL